jgi:hypothetical protein
MSGDWDSPDARNANPQVVALRHGHRVITDAVLSNLESALRLMLGIEPWYRRPGLRTAIKLVASYRTANEIPSRRKGDVS